MASRAFRASTTHPSIIPAAHGDIDDVGHPTTSTTTLSTTLFAFTAVFPPCREGGASRNFLCRWRQRRGLAANSHLH